MDDGIATPTLNSRFLAHMFAELEPPIDVGPSPDGHRLIVNARGGTFEGPNIKARFLPGGGDWLTLRADGSAAMDVRGTLQTDDGAVIYTYYGGRIVIPADIAARVMDFGTADPVGFDRYYYRSAPFFQTSHPRYAWMNNIVAVGQGGLGRGGVAYDIFEIL